SHDTRHEEIAVSLFRNGTRATARSLRVSLPALHRHRQQRMRRQRVGFIPLNPQNRRGNATLEKSASALRHRRLVEIRLELADLMKRCAWAAKLAARLLFPQKPKTRFP